MSKKKCVLIILDGWGIGAGDATDAIAQASTPFITSSYRSVPNATLLTDGENVGLPAGQMGNSEVGHLNIGAGRVIYQDLVRIDKAIADGSLESDPVLQQAFRTAMEPNRKLHFIGLLSDGGVHSMRSHLEALCHMADRKLDRPFFVHAFTDGRDTDPRNGRSYMEKFLQRTSGTKARIASVIGRYYAMDRDKRWERISKAYDLLVKGKGDVAADPLSVLDRSYSAGQTDEFIGPHVMANADGSPIATIGPGDVVICFNFRTDRCREITMALTQQPFPEFAMTPLPLHYVTMTEYDATYRDVHVIFRKDDLSMTLGEVIARSGRSQIRIAETEKYPHVTFFFSGGRELPFEGEQRIMLPSPKVPTYDLMPEMSADAIANAISIELEKGLVDLVVLNFANPDMVGHTGVFEAIVKAVETTDRCAQRVVEAGRKAGYSFIIIADHGNADKARNADGSPNTAHSTNPVPIFVIDEDVKAIRHGILADVAPTILALMKMEKPAEMTGSSLLL